MANTHSHLTRADRICIEQAFERRVKFKDAAVFMAPLFRPPQGSCRCRRWIFTGLLKQRPPPKRGPLNGFRAGGPEERAGPREAGTAARGGGNELVQFSPPTWTPIFSS